MYHFFAARRKGAPPHGRLHLKAAELAEKGLKTMAPLLPSSTSRYKLTYSTAPFEHSMIMRVVNSVTPSQASSYFDAFLAALGPLLGTITIVRLELALQASDVFNVVAWSGAATYGTGAPANIQEPAFISFTGKDALGRRARVTCFGLTGVTQQDYRFQAGESAAADAARVQLATGSDRWKTIGGLSPVWNNYANLGFNAHYQRKLRG